jgi:hypothetical protein
MTTDVSVCHRPYPTHHNRSQLFFTPNNKQTARQHHPTKTRGFLLRSIFFSVAHASSSITHHQQQKHTDEISLLTSATTSPSSPFPERAVVVGPSTFFLF